MAEEEEYKNNLPLVYLALKRENLHWHTPDELQEFIDLGSDGLLRGIRTYDETKPTKKSTYYYTCIRHGMFRSIYNKQLMKHNAKVVSLNTLIDEDTELIEMIPSEYDMEQDIETKIRNEKLIDVINHLPIEKDRYVIKYLFGLDDYPLISATELAKRWGVNKNAIIQRRNRALRILRCRIRKEDL